MMGTTAMLGMGAMAAAGSVAGGLMSRGGKDAAGGMTLEAANEAYRAAQHQRDVNNQASSPWTATGSRAVQQLGALLGYGSMYGTGAEGSSGDYAPDPNAQSNALAQLRAFAGGSGATLPTYTPNAFAPTGHSTAVSGSFQADPSYAWRVGQGVGALNSAANASGAGRSGAQDQALTKLGQDMGSQEYANWYSRLANQDKFNLGVDQWNTQGGLATNAQNFGQQQTLFGDTEGQWKNALAMLTGTAGMGLTAENANAGVNSGLTTTGSGQNMAGQIQAGNDYADGSKALASGIVGGVNSLASAGSYAMGGGFGAGGGGGDVPSPGASDAWFNALSKSPGMPGYTGGGATAAAY